MVSDEVKALREIRDEIKNLTKTVSKLSFAVTNNITTAEPEDEDHSLRIERVEDEYFVTIPHEMSKTHYISFILAAKDDGVEIRKLYPEGNPEARFKIRRTKHLYWYCNRHGLFKTPV